MKLKDVKKGKKDLSFMQRTIYISPEEIDWVKKKNINLSKLVRTAIGELRRKK